MLLGNFVLAAATAALVLAVSPANTASSAAGAQYATVAGSASMHGGRVLLVAFDSGDLDRSFVKNLAGVGQVVQISRPFAGFGSKWHALVAYLGSPDVEPDDILVVMDARDILANGLDRPLFERRVRRLAKANQILFSAEGQCCVSALGADQTQYFDDRGKRKHRTCAPHKDECVFDPLAHAQNVLPWIEKMRRRAPAGATELYLNAGVVLGTTASFAELLALADLREEEDDQAVLTALWLSNNSSKTGIEIALDYDQSLATSSNWEVGECDFVRQTVGGAAGSAVVCRGDGGGCPLFVHFNGADWQCQQKVASLLHVADDRRVRGRLSRAVDGNYNSHHTAVCKTTNGDACVFPFEYKGTNYSACTDVDYPKNSFWCATERIHTNDKKWGLCSSTCTGVSGGVASNEPSISSVSPKTGGSLTTITIRGTNLLSGLDTSPAVTIGDVAAQVISAFRTHITVRVGAGTAEGMLAVAVGSAVSAGAYTYVVPAYTTLFSAGSYYTEKDHHTIPYQDRAPYYGYTLPASFVDRGSQFSYTRYATPISFVSHTYGPVNASWAAYQHYHMYIVNMYTKYSTLFTSDLPTYNTNGWLESDYTSASTGIQTSLAAYLNELSRGWGLTGAGPTGMDQIKCSVTTGGQISCTGFDKVQVPTGQADVFIRNLYKAMSTFWSGVALNQNTKVFTATKLGAALGSVSLAFSYSDTDFYHSALGAHGGYERDYGSGMTQATAAMLQSSLDYQTASATYDVYTKSTSTQQSNFWTYTAKMMAKTTGIKFTADSCEWAPSKQVTSTGAQAPTTPAQFNMVIDTEGLSMYEGAYDTSALQSALAQATYAAAKAELNYDALVGGRAGNSIETHATFNAAFWASERRVIRRECANCVHTHQDIFYKRITQGPESWDAWANMVVSWEETNNVMGTDFNHYSTQEDADHEMNAWTLIKYATRNMTAAFPYESGPTKDEQGQWNSLTAGPGVFPTRQADYKFSVANGEITTDKPTTTCGGSAQDVGCGCGAAGPSGCDNSCGSSLITDCAGTCGGSAQDVGCGCGQPGPSGCDNSCGSSLIADCAGVCGGSAQDVGCGCGAAGPSGCDNSCGSSLSTDCAGTTSSTSTTTSSSTITSSSSSTVTSSSSSTSSSTSTDTSTSTSSSTSTDTTSSTSTDTSSSTSTDTSSSTSTDTTTSTSTDTTSSTSTSTTTTTSSSTSSSTITSTSTSTTTSSSTGTSSSTSTDTSTSTSSLTSSSTTTKSTTS